MGKKTVLSMNDLDEFARYIKSGELEKNFRLAGEIERGEILELLEKLMDVADLADQAATRLIFRGLTLPPTARLKDN